MSIQIDRLLETVVRRGASDLHLATGRPPTLRLHGSLRELQTKVLEPEDTVSLMKSITPERIQTTATVKLEKTPEGFSVPAIHLEVVARIRGGDRAAFEAAANKAKEGCPISKLLKAQITMNATLE